MQNRLAVPKWSFPLVISTEDDAPNIYLQDSICNFPTLPPLAQKFQALSQMINLLNF